MRNSWLVSISILLVFMTVSCRSYPHRFTPVEATANHFTPAFLDTTGFEHSFRVNIDAYGHSLSGIFIIKKISNHNYRMALLNEFGGTLLGFELLNSEFRLHYAIPPLRRKAFLNILEQDFKLLLNEGGPILRQFIHTDTLIYETMLDGKHAYQYLHPPGRTLAKTILTRRGRERVSITYDYRNAAFPDITLSHRHGKLNIFLFLLEEADSKTETLSP